MSSLDQLSAQYLHPVGWHRSVELQSAVDQDRPVPWFTYPATRYLAKIVRPEWRVLEFGCGNSTRWWSERVAEVVSVEHDPHWAGRLRAERMPNVTVHEWLMDSPVSAEHRSLFSKEFFPLGIGAERSPDPTRNYRAGLLDANFQAYAASLLEYPKAYFDVIVIDGMARVLTTWTAIRQCGDAGLIIFDNADRAEYGAAYRLLAAQGFQRLDFWGLGPINPYEWCTSLFIKSLASLRKANDY